jgi:hypothetical protein
VHSFSVLRAELAWRNSLKLQVFPSNMQLLRIYFRIEHIYIVVWLYVSNKILIHLEKDNNDTDGLLSMDYGVLIYYTYWDCLCIWYFPLMMYLAREWKIPQLVDLEGLCAPLNLSMCPELRKFKWVIYYLINLISTDPNFAQNEAQRKRSSLDLH